MRALVAGGAGRIGASLVDRLLAEGHHVDVVDDLSTGSLDRLAAARADRSNSLKIHRHDIVDPSTPLLVERLAPDTVYSLVAPPADAPAARNVAVGVVGAVHLLEGAASLERRPKIVVGLSGGALFGGVPETDMPVPEGTAPCPIGPDGVAAEAVLAALHTYRRSFQVEFTALVFGSVYGAQVSGRSVSEEVPVADLIAGTLSGGPVEVDTTPDATFDLIHLDDAVDALARAAERADGLVLNIGSGEETSVSLISSTLEALGRHVEVTYRAKTDRGVRLDASRAEIHLGWTPFTPLVDGLRALLLQAT